jgi:gliding motility-associated-like protein
MTQNRIPKTGILTLILAFYLVPILHAQIPANGLVVFYPFNGNANDNGPHHYNGTVNGPTLITDRCNRIDSAYAFNGDKDHITFGDITHLDGSTSLTVSAWVYTDGIKDVNSGTIVSKYSAYANSERVFIFDLGFPSENALRFCIYGADGNGDYEWEKANTSIPVSQWTHVAVTWNGNSHDINLYVNGNRISSYYGNLGELPTRVYNKTSPLMIGGSQFGFTTVDYMFNGSIDDVLIYNRALSDTEIRKLYYFDCKQPELIGNQVVCQGEKNKLYSIDKINNADYSWSYSGMDVTLAINNNQANLNFGESSSSGILTVSVSGIGILTQVYSIPITVNSLPGPALEITGEQSICLGRSYDYNIAPISDATEYSWDYSNSGATINANLNSVNIFFADDSKSGSLTVAGTNNCGMGMKSPPLPIIVNNCNFQPESLRIPNAFSPNGDGINDFFVIEGLPINSQLTIFSRAGKKLYTSDNYQNEWNGNDQDGAILETGTYWYVIRINGINSDLKGFVYLKRQD